MATHNSSALAYPFIVGVERLLEIDIGDNLVGQGAAPTSNAGASRIRRCTWLR